MAQVVMLSDELAFAAHVAAALDGRSISEQIDYWASIGRAIDPLLTGQQAQKLLQSEKMSLSECIRTVQTERGRRLLREHLDSLPFPHFEAVSGRKGVLVRIEADGKRIVGRFVNREFRPLARRAK